MDETYGFRSVVFGWDTVDLEKPIDDPISKLFEGYGESIICQMQTILEIDVVLLDEKLLLGTATFLNLQLSSPNFGATLSKSHLNKWVDVKFYLSSNYLPPGSGPTLWTPLLCFPQNSLP